MLCAYDFWKIKEYNINRKIIYTPLQLYIIWVKNIGYLQRCEYGSIISFQSKHNRLYYITLLKWGFI